MSAPDGGCGGVERACVVYTRAAALIDGVLVDVSREASPAEMAGGFVVPVAVTGAVWHAIGAIPQRLAGLADVRGRLHDVLWMAGLAARRPATGAFLASFAVRLPVRGSRKTLQRLVLAIGPDDTGAACVTIGFPEDF